MHSSLHVEREREREREQPFSRVCTHRYILGNDDGTFGPSIIGLASVVTSPCVPQFAPRAIYTDFAKPAIYPGMVHSVYILLVLCLYYGNAACVLLFASLLLFAFLRRDVRTGCTGCCCIPMTVCSLHRVCQIH